jgi:ElaB/YqjD/DUF883 family membrane-anchored ribosome-binding protein
MPNEAELLKGEIAQTREQLGSKLNQFESEVSHTFDNVVDTVKTTAKNLHPIEQVKRHPLPALGIATAAGFFVTAWFRNGKRAPVRMPTFLGQELKAAKAVGVSLLLRTVADKIKQKSPELASHLKEVENDVIERMSHGWRPTGA